MYFVKVCLIVVFSISATWDVCHAQKKVEEKGILQVGRNTVAFVNSAGEGMGPDTVFVEKKSDTAEMEIRYATVVSFNDIPVQNELDGAIDRRLKLVRCTNKILFDYLFEQLMPMLQKLRDGDYIFPVINVVSDENGAIVFYQARGIQRLEKEYLHKDPTMSGRYWSAHHESFNYTCDNRNVLSYSVSHKRIPMILRTRLKRKLKRLMKYTVLESTGIDGPACWSYNVFDFENKIEVKDHKVTIWLSIPRLLREREVL